MLPKDPNDDKNKPMPRSVAVQAVTVSRLFLQQICSVCDSKLAERKPESRSQRSANENGIGGFERNCGFMVIGQGAYSKLKYESGVHRVQRIPSTESG